MRKLLHALVANALLLAASTAYAKANHKIEAVQKIVKDGEVVGARVHLLVEPQYYDRFRINVAPHAMLPEACKQADGEVHADTVKRQTLAGVRRGFVIKTLAERTGARDLVEMYVDIPYGRTLKAGDKVNLLSSFTTGSRGFKASSEEHIHIFGAWDGPTNGGDPDYIITLPDASSTVPNATETLAAAK